MDEQTDLDVEPAGHTYLVAAKCESPDGDVTKEYGFVDADTPDEAAAVARSVWKSDDKTPVGEIYVADFTESFEVSAVDLGDGSE
ncbi:MULTISPECIES: hypothetical protein [Halorussus]|uniref:hypothetical protein n=1 Tax=Halorussus TaxID=1070314 RepID=UPI000E210869|nr:MULTISPECIES: hypothetical protein [Halorussus]NHN60324.1 hypothetical protein [Halorussus sp. JP-T4]